ncbi:MAG: glycoside hydrolase family 16 protein [Clostridia bacterium]|nr:glycoside hydrolase family 16 protein [Clostridia bacterium]
MFKSLLKILIAFLMLISPAIPSALSLGKLPSDRRIDMEKFSLKWEDNFDGDSLDTSKWGYTWWETERKGGYWHEDMVSVRDGNLVIRAEYLETPPENYYYDDWHEQIDFKEYKPGWYTGIVTTQGKYEQCYGYFEVRCILPAATGMWSAFWMMNEGVFNVDGSGKDGTEVDIFESFYYKDHWWGDDCIITGIHYDGYGEGHNGDSLGKIFIENDPYKNYNTYGVEWNKDEYIFYINGYETGRLSTGGVSQNPEYLLLSCEFAGENGIQSSDRHGTGRISLTPDKNWPAEFIVDYVKCYQYKDPV